MKHARMSILDSVHFYTSSGTVIVWSPSQGLWGLLGGPSTIETPFCAIVSITDA